MIKVFGRRLYPVLAAILFLALATGCKKDNDDADPIPEDHDPSIVLVSPSQNYVLDSVGSTVTFKVKLADNELLNLFRLTSTIESATGAVYQQETLEYDRALSTTTWTETVNYTIPTWVQPYSKIFLTAYADDNKGKTVKTTFTVNVIPKAAGSSGTFGIEHYPSGDTIYENGATFGGGPRYYFDFIGRSNLVTNATRRDIGEISSPTFSAMFNSPNNGAADSIFVVTDTTRLDFQNLDYNTAYQAFVTNANQLNQVGPLQVGQVVILKMNAVSPIDPGRPQYAVFIVRGFGTANGFNFMRFEYKRVY